MRIYKPSKNCFISQSFGLQGTKPSLIPLYNSLGYKAHAGLDFSVMCKDNQVIHGGQCEPVYCNVIGTGDLTVTYVQKDDKGGYGIIALDEMWNKFFFWHFDVIDPLIYVGRKLKLGDLLGISGNTGVSTGAHLHLEWHQYGEPEDNGYKGATDPVPYYDDRFCLNIKTQIELLQKLIDAYMAIVKLLK